MASVSAVRDGLKARLATIAGLRAHDTVPGSINPPAAIVAPDPGTFLIFDTSMSRGSDDLLFVVTLFVVDAVDRAAQDALDGYLAGSGAQSVKAAVEADQTLGGVASFVEVREARNYGTLEYAGTTYLGCEFVVRVAVLGT